MGILVKTATGHFALKTTPQFPLAPGLERQSHAASDGLFINNQVQGFKNNFKTLQSCK